MAERDDDFQVFSGDDDEPLISEDCGCRDEAPFVYDEDGSLTMAGALSGTGALATAAQPAATSLLAPLTRPCSRTALNGSWLLTLTPTTPSFLTQIRGPMRIEVTPSRVRISGDVYVRSLIFPPVITTTGATASTAATMLAGASTSFIPGSLLIRRNWYPAFPQREYRWYFRSLGVFYSNGRLIFRFVRHLWNRTTQEFVSSDFGSMTLNCSQSFVSLIGFPQPTIQMKGTANIGGAIFNVTATKTSPFYRGCLVEVDVMTNRSWPSTAPACGGGSSFSFTGVYRGAGLDFRAVVNELNVPQDNSLTIAELNNLLATHRNVSAGGDNWHLWLLVGSRLGNSGTLGIMFDTSNPPHREGAVGFFDPTLGSSSVIAAFARNKKLGEVPLAFLRTLIHEAGHAFNLFHPKSDVHTPGIGTTVMNQTGDVIGFATAANPYPCNATLDFNSHNRTSLIHSSDPQVKPGWKPFGWGHGSLSGGLPEPVDALGINDDTPEDQGLSLKLSLPEAIHRGEIVVLEAELANVSDHDREVTTALNLSEGDLNLIVRPPSGASFEARDLVLACSSRRTVVLKPGDSIKGQIQLSYTSAGFTFDQPGRYQVQGELATGGPIGGLVRSNNAEMMVHPAATAKERELEKLMTDQGVGVSLALGDYGIDEGAEKKLTQVMKGHSNTDSGAACAMVLSNSWAAGMRDYRKGAVARKVNDKAAQDALDIALKGRGADRAAALACAIVSPRQTEAPLLDELQKRLATPAKGAYKKSDLDAAKRILSDHLK